MEKIVGHIPRMQELYKIEKQYKELLENEEERQKRKHDLRLAKEVLQIAQALREHSRKYGGCNYYGLLLGRTTELS